MSSRIPEAAHPEPPDANSAEWATALASRARNWPVRRWWAWSTWFSPTKLSDSRFMIRLWVIARAIIFAIWLIAVRSAQGDVYYYYDRIRDLGQLGPAKTLTEYPTPVIWVLQIPYLLGFGQRVGYLIAFVAIMLALDAGFTHSLWRHGGRLRGIAVLFWTIFLFFVGPTAYLRFDLLPSVLAGWALLAAAKNRFGRAGALVGLGAATKLWPALLWPALLRGLKKDRIKATVAMFGLGGALAVISLLWGGWDRLLSPLTWQGGRHLQVESIWATIPMVLRIFFPYDYWVGVSSFQAFEIWGPGTNAFLLMADAATYLGYLLIIACYIRWLWPGRSQRRIEAAVLMLMVVLVIIVSNKTFSPQYIMWVGGPLAAGLAMVSSQDDPNAARRRRDERRLIRTGTVLLAITLLTQLVYPIGYAGLVKRGFMRIPVTLVLAVRNLGIVLLLVWVLQWIWSFLRRDRGPERSAERPGHRDRTAPPTTIGAVEQQSNRAGA